MSELIVGLMIVGIYPFVVMVISVLLVNPLISVIGILKFPLEFVVPVNVCPPTDIITGVFGFAVPSTFVFVIFPFEPRISTGWTWTNLLFKFSNPLFVISKYSLAPVEFPILFFPE